jgi:hypothetical protein
MAKLLFILIVAGTIAEAMPNPEPPLLIDASVPDTAR